MGHANRTAQSETSDQPRYVIRVGELTHDSYGLDFTPERTGWKQSSLYVVALTSGKPLAIPTGEHEHLVLPLSGGHTVQAGGERLEVAGRGPVFIDITDYVCIPRCTEVTLTGVDGARIALPSSRAATNKPLRYCPRSEVDTSLQGADPFSHQVNSYTLGNDVRTSHLLACEVLTPGGNWSSYPPHKHGRHIKVKQVLERIYYYQVCVGEGDAEGFAFRRIYPLSGYDIDVCTEVRGGSVVVVPCDYHGPSVAALGYDLYYLSVMVGLTENSVWPIADGPHHTWMRQTWEGQEVSPRLPMTPVNDQLIRLSIALPPEKSREEPR